MGVHHCHALVNTSDTQAFRVYSPVWSPFPSDASAVSPVNADTALLLLDQLVQLHSWSSFKCQHMMLWHRHSRNWRKYHYWGTLMFVLACCPYKSNTLPSPLHQYSCCHVYSTGDIKILVIPKTQISVKTWDQPLWGIRSIMHLVLCITIAHVALANK